MGTEAAHLAATQADPGAALGSDPSLIGAAVDVGATSVHLLVASIDGATLQSIADASVFLELGRATRERAVLGEEARKQLTDALRAYADAARTRGATRIAFVGTEPLRRAADASRVVLDVGRACAIPLHVLSHEEEALLTIVGVMAGRRVDRETLVLDVGGGSSEFSLIDPDRSPRIVGLKLGSATLVDAFVGHDPPTVEERDAMRAAALTALDAALDTKPAKIVAVGGTASNLRKLVAGVDGDGLLTRDSVAEAVRVLASGTADAIAAEYGLNPIRARLLPGGAAILDSVMQRYGVDAVRVSDDGIREGLVRALAHRAWAWRDALPELAKGWIP